MATPTKPSILTPPSEPTPIERVEAWTVSQAADVLSATSISSPTPAPAVRGASVRLDIPLDEAALNDDRPRSKPEAVHVVHKRREPVRRDSLKRREALLKGKEGSRQRRRWENDRLVGNPYAQPPLPEDWEVRPMNQRQSVPYFLAPLWDAEYARLNQQRELRKAKVNAPTNKEEEAAAQVKRELRAKLKRSRGAKALLQDLEQEVRGFVEQWEEKQRQLEAEGVIEPDSEDEEIVFVGRNGAMSDEMRAKRESEGLERDKVVFESLVHDHGASFGRFLVHAIAQYYDLATWSVTTRDAPPKRQAQDDRGAEQVAHPLVDVKRSVEFLVPLAHDEWEKMRSQEDKALRNKPTDELINAVSAIAKNIAGASALHDKWWTSPEKRWQRDLLVATGDETKLSKLYAIRKETTDMIEEMEAKVGLFAKWCLGLDGGFEQLKNRTGNDESLKNRAADAANKQKTEKGKANDAERARKPEESDADKEGSAHEVESGEGMAAFWEELKAKRVEANAKVKSAQIAAGIARSKEIRAAKVAQKEAEKQARVEQAKADERARLARVARREAQETTTDGESSTADLGDLWDSAKSGREKKDSKVERKARAHRRKHEEADLKIVRAKAEQGAKRLMKKQEKAELREKERAEMKRLEGRLSDMEVSRDAAIEDDEEA
ncbi:uncharacterized protein LTR77_010866 [Saxophila tyrrhenica]|uniref:R3H-associated N-terminal domain-containing protein n=1 Tax=Saxophila tyrrhenica TaxID=1690608 RepID=A0AAV9NUL2_9PEZI|nr:hypothetical protein LTR77_010866 [Saxophila tyrrhenica]